jgi:hypothetical protein
VNLINKFEDWAFRNKSNQSKIKRVSFKNLDIKLEWTHREKPMNRFGGGWKYEVGFQVANNALIINLLLFSIRIDKN